MKNSFRPSSEIELQLAEFESSLPKGVTGPPPNDFAAKLQWDAWQHHRHELQTELDLAIDQELERSDFLLSIDGDPVSDHAIQAGFLGTFLDKSQKLINAIAQVFEQRPTGRGVIPNQIIADSRLMVEGVFPSSFGLKLRLPTETELGHFRFSHSEEILDQFCKLIDPQLEQTELAQIISHKRVKSHYLGLVDAVAKAGASLRVRTPRLRSGVRLNAAQARDKVTWLTTFNAETSTYELTGVLTGGNIASNRFELEVDEDAYKGTISAHAREQMLQICLGNPVRVTIQETTLTAEEGQTEGTVSYHLMKIERVNES